MDNRRAVANIKIPIYNSDCIWTDLTDLSCKVNEAIREVSPEVPNAICFALSDKVLTYYVQTLLTYNSESILVDAQKNVSMLIRDNRNIPTEDGSNTSILVKINPDTKLIEFTISLMIYFYKDDTLFASCNVQFLLKAMPNLNIDFLEFLVTDMQLLTPQTSQSITVINLDIINASYGSVEQFVTDLNSLLEEFTKNNELNSSNNVNWILPALVNMIQLPDDWRYIQGAVLHFAKFHYKQVRLMGSESGCLFVVFTVQSLNQPFPCNCDDFSDFMNFTFEPLNNSRRQLAIGISQDAFFEILKPLVDSALTIDHSDSTGNGEIRAEVSYWLKGQLTNLELLNDGIHCNLNSVEAGGYVAAALRVLKRNLWKKKVGLKVELKDTNINLHKFQLITDYEQGELRITTEPDITIGDINVELQPDIQELEWILDVITNKHKGQLERKLQNSIKFAAFKKPRQRYTNGIMDVEFAYIDFFEHSSLVILMQVAWID
ncbi:hypothetical protein ACIQ61_25280 [Bacillus cereus]|uniref:hypothetical protein n=1 Tax=Bacillus cereus TaxID=1396 RepID=UPI003812441D